MSSEWLTTMKPTFQSEWLALSPKETHQILEKLTLLTKDPRPDGNIKKQLTHKNRQLHRLESGNYRIIYTFEHPYISLIALRRRKENTYDEDFKSEYLGGFDPDITDDTEKLQIPQEQVIATPKTPLPEAITKELLVNLFVPAEYHARLLRIDNGDDLLDCPAVPNEFKEKIYTHMFEKPLVQVIQEPDFILSEVNDLMRYKKGELLGFLLKLSPEQEKYAQWGLHATGPTLLKGGPGTGKSTIALYRARSLVEDLRKQGQENIRILFTTYTNALVSSTKQLLDQLLGDDSQYVHVQTVDKIVKQIIAEAKAPLELIESNEFDDLLQQAIKETKFSGTPAQKQAKRQAIERLSFDYLQQEINSVIVAGQLQTLEEYLTASRPGRRVPLSKLQRQAVWEVHETLQHLLAQEKKETWQQLRARAANYLAQGLVTLSYDAVIIDEAQDLDPSALRLLVQLCRTPNRLFITADANQSIYGSHFSWSHIHEELRFRGRTATLQANYRSTQEIGEAAQAYLTGGTLDSELVERHYVHHGPLPIVRKIFNEQDEAQLLASYLATAARTYRMSLDACAILCPTEKAGRSLANTLSRYNIGATFMSGQYLNLKQPGVKILTLNSSKGLEFPIVALAGLSKSNKYMQKSSSPLTEEQEEVLALDRRLLFVGMTRAMRALLVAIPEKTSWPLLIGFDTRYWNMEQ